MPMLTFQDLDHKHVVDRVNALTDAVLTEFDNAFLGAGIEEQLASVADVLHAITHFPSENRIVDDSPELVEALQRDFAEFRISALLSRLDIYLENGEAYLGNDPAGRYDELFGL